MSLEVGERNFREDGWQLSSDTGGDMVKGRHDCDLGPESNNEEQMLLESSDQQRRATRRSCDRKGVSQRPLDASWNHRSSSQERWEFGGMGSGEPGLPGNSEGLQVQRAPGTPSKCGTGGGAALSEKNGPRGGHLESGCGTRRSQRKRKPVKGEAE